MNDELKEYIESQRSQGVSDDTIKNTLKEQGGWSEEDLSTIFGGASEKLQNTYLNAEQQSPHIESKPSRLKFFAKNLLISLMVSFVIVGASYFVAWGEVNYITGQGKNMTFFFTPTESSLTKSVNARLLNREDIDQGGYIYIGRGIFGYYTYLYTQKGEDEDYDLNSDGKTDREELDIAMRTLPFSVDEKGFVAIYYIYAFAITAFIVLILISLLGYLKRKFTSP
jgi:hypothetical protein